MGLYCKLVNFLENGIEKLIKLMKKTTIQGTAKWKFNPIANLELPSG